MSSSSHLLSYGSIVLDHEDLLLLQDGQWLNDRLITFAGEYLMDQLTPEEREKIEMVCAATCELLKFASDVPSWLSAYQSRDLIFFVVNNNTDPTRPGGGSHWSLLIYEKTANRFAYLDSLNNPITKTAQVIMMNSAKHLCPPGHKPTLQVVPCPKQQNMNDCGMLVIEFVRFMLSYGRRSPTRALEMLAVHNMDEAYIRQCRKNWLSVIDDLVKQSKFLPQ